MIPFSTEVFFRLFAQYNAAIWPAQLIAYGLGLAAVLLAFRPRGGSDRLVGAILAAAWIWMGVVYHMMFFATINFTAPVFGALFVLQGLLLAWTGALRGRLPFRFRADLLGWIGLGFVTFAMILYPLIGWLAGHGWPEAQMFGVAPCPTTIFTLGMLLLADGRAPLHLSAIPLLWSLIGGSAAWLLDVPEDLALLPAGAAFGCLIVLKNRSPAVADRG